METGAPVVRKLVGRKAPRNVPQQEAVILPPGFRSQRQENVEQNIVIPVTSKITFPEAFSNSDLNQQEWRLALQNLTAETISLFSKSASFEAFSDLLQSMHGKPLNIVSNAQIDLFTNHWNNVITTIIRSLGADFENHIQETDYSRKMMHAIFPVESMKAMILNYYSFKKFEQDLFDRLFQIKFALLATMLNEEINAAKNQFFRPAATISAWNVEQILENPQANQEQTTQYHEQIEMFFNECYDPIILNDPAQKNCKETKENAEISEEKDLEDFVVPDEEEENSEVQDAFFLDRLVSVYRELDDANYYHDLETKFGEALDKTPDLGPLIEKTSPRNKEKTNSDFNEAKRFYDEYKEDKRYFVPLAKLHEVKKANLPAVPSKLKKDQKRALFQWFDNLARARVALLVAFKKIKNKESKPYVYGMMTGLSQIWGELDQAVGLFWEPWNELEEELVVLSEKLGENIEIEQEGVEVSGEKKKKKKTKPQEAEYSEKALAKTEKRKRRQLRKEAKIENKKTLKERLHQLSSTCNKKSISFILDLIEKDRHNKPRLIASVPYYLRIDAVKKLSKIDIMRLIIEDPIFINQFQKKNYIQIAKRRDKLSKKLLEPKESKIQRFEKWLENLKKDSAKGLSLPERNEQIAFQKELFKKILRPILVAKEAHVRENVEEFWEKKFGFDIATLIKYVKWNAPMFTLDVFDKGFVVNRTKTVAGTLLKEWAKIFQHEEALKPTAKLPQEIVRAQIHQFKTQKQAEKPKQKALQGKTLVKPLSSSEKRKQRAAIELLAAAKPSRPAKKAKGVSAKKQPAKPTIPSLKKKQKISAEKISKPPVPKPVHKKVVPKVAPAPIHKATSPRKSPSLRAMEALVHAQEKRQISPKKTGSTAKKAVAKKTVHAKVVKPKKAEREGYCKMSLKDLKKTDLYDQIKDRSLHKSTLNQEALCKLLNKVLREQQK